MSIWNIEPFKDKHLHAGTMNHAQTPVSILKRILEEKVFFNLPVGDIDIIRIRRKMKIILPHAIHH